MKKLLIASLACIFSAATLPVATSAQAQPAPHHAKTKAKHRTASRKKAAAPKEDPIEQGAVQWKCGDNESFWLGGDMKRDQIVTLHWQGRNFKLPRATTSTGADRFHDIGSGMDLVVIPFKAMLFSDKDSARLADDCKTQEMVEHSVPAPTQANALLK